ncbi:MAG: glycosyltransferase family 2 protein [Blastocatellia bacterium]|nr:glycosyltransferase family 2 protein [Blastocatellia bacterium]
MKPDLPQFSLVVPIFNEESLIHVLHAEVLRVMESIGEPWEVVYVNDGSSDRSLELLLERQRADERVVVAELSRNWGHQSALTAGLSLAQGQAVILMDGDLQDPPEVIREMVTAWREGGQVIVAERRKRTESGLRRLWFPLFYRILAYLSDFPIPLNAGIFGLLDRKAVDAILKLTESNRYLPGLRSWVGFRTAVIYYERAGRYAGEPKQTFWKLLRYGLDAIFSFSYKPLRLSLVMGLLTAGFALFYGMLLLVCRVWGIGMFGIPVVDGYTSTIVSILFLGGTQLICVGVLGEYIGRIYDEVKRRPLFFIQQVHRTSVPPSNPT